MTTESTNARWLTESLDALTLDVQHSTTRPLVQKFIEMGIPILKRFKSGFLAETGDIVVCLLIHVLDDELKVQVCNIDDQGQLQARLETQSNVQSYALIQSFVQSFPHAVLTTSTRKPLCLFFKHEAKEDQKKRKPNKREEAAPEELNSLGTFQGYMSFDTFARIVKTQTDQNSANKITVAVP